MFADVIEAFTSFDKKRCEKNSAKSIDLAFQEVQQAKK